MGRPALRRTSRLLRTHLAHPRRTYANTTPPTPTPKSPPSSNPSSTPQTRLQTLTQRLPRPLRKYTSALANAPTTHIATFLLLHEITAVIPLFGLAAAFHYANWLPTWLVEGEVVRAGVEKFGAWFRRRGWVGEGEVVGDGEGVREGRGLEGGARWVVEFATAYAVVKVLLPVRIIGCLWGTPWVAGKVVGPVGRWVGRVFGRASKSR